MPRPIIKHVGEGAPQEVGAVAAGLPSEEAELPECGDPPGYPHLFIQRMQQLALET